MKGIHIDALPPLTDCKRQVSFGAARWGKTATRRVGRNGSLGSLEMDEDETRSDFVVWISKSNPYAAGTCKGQKRE